jgi:hypothetical protein
VPATTRRAPAAQRYEAARFASMRRWLLGEAGPRDQARYQRRPARRPGVIASLPHELNKVTPAARQRSGVRHQEKQLPMQIHRSRHARGFTALPNTLLQDRRLSYTARGLLADLLSRPDGWREDGRRMADSSPQGRTTVAKALRELARAGYYRVEKVRQPDGTVISEAHVYDTPQSASPAVRFAGSGRRAPDLADALSKDREKEPSLPTEEPNGHARSGVTGDGEGGRVTTTTPSVAGAHAVVTADEVPPHVRDAVATLFRVIRPEARLRLGTTEALGLAPLVTTWLERGASERDLAAVLLPGLPERVHSPSALLSDRLRRKLPLTPEVLPQDTRPRTRWHECAKCADPIRQPGICRACAGLAPRQATVGSGAAVTARGIAKVRSALRSAATA